MSQEPQNGDSKNDVNEQQFPPISTTMRPSSMISSPAADHELGLCYEQGSEGRQKDLKEAVRLFTSAASQGYAAAQFSLGNCYMKGLGVDENPAEAVRLFKLASIQGLASAQLALGTCYEKGEHIGFDLNKALCLYILANKQGNLDADAKLRWHDDRNMDGVALAKAEETVESLLLYNDAFAGDSEAQYDLAMCYYTGDGFEKDLKTAIHWFVQSANQELVRAQHKLWLLYEKGEDVPKNSKKALFWCRKVANNKTPLASAQYRLGLIYQNGENDVPQDINEARYWFRKAAKQNFSEAIEHLEDLDKETADVKTPIATTSRFIGGNPRNLPITTTETSTNLNLRENRRP